MSGEVQEYVSRILKAYCLEYCWVRSRLGLDGCKESVRHIGHPREGVNYVKEGDEHQV